MRAGSLVNLIGDTALDNTEAAVGVGVTEIMWTDRRAGTIIEVKRNGRTLVVQYDEAIRTDANGMSDAQSYRFERNTDAATREFTLRKDGTYRVKGGSGRLILGVRDAYHDYSF
jgi:hypothetical protein